MFEGTIIAASAKPGAANALRPLDWPEIVARLAAARDLRAMLARAPVAEVASPRARPPGSPALRLANAVLTLML